MATLLDQDFITKISSMAELEEVGVAYAAPPRARRLTHTGCCDIVSSFPLPGDQ